MRRGVWTPLPSLQTTPHAALLARSQPPVPDGWRGHPLMTPPFPPPSCSSPCPAPALAREEGASRSVLLCNHSVTGFRGLWKIPSPRGRKALPRSTARTLALLVCRLGVGESHSFGPKGTFENKPDVAVAVALGTVMEVPFCLPEEPFSQSGKRLGPCPQSCCSPTGPYAWCHFPEGAASLRRRCS